MATAQEFQKAIKGGDLAAVQAMLAETPALKNARTEKGVHAVVLAIYYGRKDISDEILRHNPELTIHDAATVGDFGRVKQLVTRDPGVVDSLSGDGFTALG
ncbi:MAG: hypothetical protein ACREDF_04660, partial [Thermoplasmata archaeon]